MRVVPSSPTNEHTLEGSENTAKSVVRFGQPKIKRHHFQNSSCSFPRLPSDMTSCQIHQIDFHCMTSNIRLRLATGSGGTMIFSHFHQLLWCKFCAVHIIVGKARQKWVYLNLSYTCRRSIAPTISVSHHLSPNAPLSHSHSQLSFGHYRFLFVISSETRNDHIQLISPR